MNKYELKNGDELILRNGEVIYYLNGSLYEMNDKGIMYPMLGVYDDNLKHVLHKEYDVIKVVYEDTVVMERETDWSEVEIGTPVIVWDNAKYRTYTGKFIHYDANEDTYKFLALVDCEDAEHGRTVDAMWFTYCKLLPDVE